MPGIQKPSSEKYSIASGPTSVTSRSLVMGPSASNGLPSLWLCPVTELPPRTTAVLGGMFSANTRQNSSNLSRFPLNARRIAFSRFSSSVRVASISFSSSMSGIRMVFSISMRRKPVERNGEPERCVKDLERSRERTMNRALKLLAAKSRSVGELRERLLEKLWTNEAIVDGVIEKLKEYKYLDDEQFARDVAMLRLRQKPQGKRRLQQAMSRKKLDRDVVDNAIAAAFEKYPQEELIDEAIAKRLRLKGKPITRDETKKFFDHLLRLGFDYDLIRTKLKELAAMPDQDGL